MTTTLPRPRWASDHLRRVSVEDRLAARWRKKPATVKRMLYGSGSLNLLAADVIEEFAAAGGYERYAHWAAPIEAAQQSIATPELTNSLIEEAQEASAGENLILLEYVLDRSDANRRRLLVALSRERAANLRLAMALQKEPTQ